ncbi:hypothetical protein BP6252_05189 [Coleophoma cylindrospora]|uniref:Uncharacterized protein n=1 Tax=Coleophoma cylindrospora TaxID=1849047 RepID=A0A3D8RT56_9HELO|nr:hypothetical protein BP6252_05189 [Coleophoma cylindrospora]
MSSNIGFSVNTRLVPTRHGARTPRLSTALITAEPTAVADATSDMMALTGREDGERERGIVEEDKTKGKHEEEELSDEHTTSFTCLFVFIHGATKKEKEE